MKKVTSQAIFDAFEQEMQSILAHFLRGGSSELVQCEIMHYHPLTDGCVVSAWDAWARFIRGLMLAGAAGPVQGISGVTYSPKLPRSEPVALKWLVDYKVQQKAAYSLAFRNKGEPKWYQASDSYDIARALGLQNAQIIGDAVTVSSLPLERGLTLGNPLGELQRVRNYIAHKSDTNLAKAKQGALKFPGNLELEAYLHSKTSGGSLVFADWIDALVIMANQAAN